MSRFLTIIAGICIAFALGTSGVEAAGMDAGDEWPSWIGSIDGFYYDASLDMPLREALTAYQAAYAIDGDTIPEPYRPLHYNRIHPVQGQDTLPPMLVQTGNDRVYDEPHWPPWIGRPVRY